MTRPNDKPPRPKPAQTPPRKAFDPTALSSRNGGRRKEVAANVGRIVHRYQGK